ncbi:HNH endonuclease [Candidatus Bathyarchaeota archaeon]|nr:HNH endonuclease [Candidatus Bathyarchaeota archaeon]
MTDKHYVEEIYRTRICHWCRRHLKDGDKTFKPFTDTIILCEDCKEFLINPPNFSPHGSKERGTTSWVTARTLTLIRDDCHCRVCESHYTRENPVEVHHIIPRKDGGTHNLKNLITLCEEHHKETFKNGYAGLEILDRQIQLGKQSRLLEVEVGG